MTGRTLSHKHLGDKRQLREVIEAKADPWDAAYEWYALGMLATPAFASTENDRYPDARPTLVEEYLSAAYGKSGGVIHGRSATGPSSRRDGRASSSGSDTGRPDRGRLRSTHHRRGRRTLRYEPRHDLPTMERQDRTRGRRRDRTASIACRSRYR